MKTWTKLRASIEVAIVVVVAVVVAIVGAAVAVVGGDECYWCYCYAAAAAVAAIVAVAAADESADAVADGESVAGEVVAGAIGTVAAGPRWRIAADDGLAAEAGDVGAHQWDRAIDVPDIVGSP